MPIVQPEVNVARPGGILIVGRDPGEYEVEQGRPFVGPAGHLLDELLGVAGWRREDVNIANLCGVRPPYDDFRRHTEEDVQRGRAELDDLVARLKPALIITLGNEAAYHFVAGWPSGGRGIVGSKGIEDRRGYFWESTAGWVFTTLHPAGALRKIVPGYELLRRDFARARRWLRGKLPRREFPSVMTLGAGCTVRQLLQSEALAADIETRYGQQIFTTGFCGDDLQPVVAKYGRGFSLMRPLLAGRPGLVGLFHNGQYDVDLLDRNGFPTTLYTDDTQTAWGNGLEPELAFRDDSDTGGRLTRKGLASLASLHPDLNVPYWKEAYPRLGMPTWSSGYPIEGADDQAELAKLYTMAGRDAYVTRCLWDWLQPEMKTRGVEPQYRLALQTNLCCITMTRRGWRVDEPLRQERITALTARAEEAQQVSGTAALSYIERHQLEAFQWVKQCDCCSGVGERCWRCAGLPHMPKRKAEYAPAFPDWEQKTAAELKASLPVCSSCTGTGKHTGYSFNPFSRDQLVKLFYEHVGAPKWVFKGKEKMDEMAVLKLLQWAGV
jgi:uracil-DNA glycosylase family 4